MSYQTYYTLGIHEPAEMSEEEVAKHQVAVYKEFIYADDPDDVAISVLSGDDEATWYKHHENMLEYSKRHPDTTFVLDGTGEGWLDVWRVFYRNGHSQRWEVEDNRPEAPWQPWPSQEDEA